MKDKKQINKEEYADRQRRVWTALAMANVYQERARQLQRKNDMLERQKHAEKDPNEKPTILNRENQLLGKVLSGLEASLVKRSRLIPDLTKSADRYQFVIKPKTKEPLSMSGNNSKPIRNSLVFVHAFCVAAALLFLRALCIKLIISKSP